MKRLICLMALLLPFLGLCAGARAQTVLAVAVARSVAEEAAAVYVHSINLYRERSLSTQPLFGRAPMGPLLLREDAQTAVLTTGYPPGQTADFRKGAAHTFFDTAPLHALQDRWYPEAQWDAQVAAVMPGTPQRLVTTSRPTLDAPEDALPFLSLHAFDPAYPAPLHIFPLPGAAAAVAAFAGAEGAGRVVVACDTPEAGGMALWLLDEQLQPLAAPAPLALQNAFAPQVRLAHVPFLAAAVSLSSSYETETGEPVSLLEAFHSQSLAPLAPPLQLRGHPAGANDALHVGKDGDVWALTRVPGTTFAYITRASLAGKRWEVLASYPIAPVNNDLHLALSPESDTVAVAIDAVVEVWPKGRRLAPAQSLAVPLPTPVRAITWAEGMLVAAEAGRVHSIDPSRMHIAKTVQLQTGRVAQLLPLPRKATDGFDMDGDGLNARQESEQGTLIWNPDSDGDGIPDGIDPLPQQMSPLLTAPADVQFRGEAVGREVQSMLIGPHRPMSARWSLDYDSDAAPWMRVHPVAGYGTTPVYLGVDPAWYAAEETAVAEITVTMADAANSPSKVLVAVHPPPLRVQQVLWLWGSEAQAPLRSSQDPRELGELAELLAEPPLLFAHTENVGPFQGRLEEYSVIVAEAAAIEQGVVTRQALLDYIAKGGALLFLGEMLDAEDGRSIANWFAPLGLRIDTQQPVSGIYGVRQDAAPFEMPEVLRFEEGSLLHARPEQVLAPAGEEIGEAAVLAGAHGYGRYVFFAGPGPLESSSLQQQGNREMAAAMFRWLARAALEYDDLDRDGLPAAAEAALGTSVVNPDSDGDALPDGLEDRNRNGSVDYGETNPLAADTDGDGILDGADIAPIVAGE